MNQLKRGAILSYLNIFITNVVGLLLTPYIIRSLGNSEYGLYTLIGAFVGYIGILDFGLNNTIVRYVSKYRVEKDKEGEESFLATTTIVYLAISLLILLIGIVLYFNLDRIFLGSLTSQELEKAKIMYIILIFNLAITIPGGAFTAICSAYEEFVFPRLINIIRYIMRSVLVVVILFAGFKAIGLVVLDTILNLSVILIMQYYVYNKLNIIFKFRLFNKSLIKEIFSYSIWIFIYSLVIQFQWNSGQVILGMNTNTAIVAVYATGILLAGYYTSIASVVNSLLLPHATKIVIANVHSSKYTEEMIRVGRFNLFVLLPILLGFYLFGKSFIRLWVGDTYLYSWHIAFLIMVVMTLPLIQSFGNSILEAKKKNQFKSLLSLTTLSTAVLTGFVFSKEYGINGVLYSLVFFMAINSIVMLFYFKKIFNFDILKFLLSVFPKGIVISICCIIIFKLILQYYPIYGWFDLCIYVLCFTLIYAVYLYTIWFNTEEKKQIKL